MSSSHSLCMIMHTEVPRVTNTIQDKREYLVGEGSLTYTCQFEGAPLPNVTFYFNGAIISNASRGMTIIGNTLIIPSPQVSHSGLYQCIVSNEFSDDQQAWLLEIRQPSEYITIFLVAICPMKPLIYALFSFTKIAAIEPYRTWWT